MSKQQKQKSALVRQTLKTAQTYSAVCIAAGLTPYVAGSPGLGKSAMFAKICKEQNLKMIDIRLAQEDPTTINGFPSLENGRSRYLPPEIFPLTGKDVLPLKPEHAGKVAEYREALATKDAAVIEKFQKDFCYAGWLVFFDELPSAPRSVQAAAYKIILDRMIGQTKIHPNCHLAAAGNLMDDNAIVNEMGTALRSRMVHIHVETDAKDYINYTVRAKYDPRITSFLAYKNTAVNNFKQFNANSADETFCCERTWEFADKLLKQFSPVNDQPIDDFYTDLLCGTLGSTAIEFVAYTQAFKDLPSFAEIMHNPTGCKIPEKEAVQYLLMGMLAGNATMENVDTIMTYVQRFQEEYGFICVKMLWGKSDAFLDNPKVEEMFIKAGDMMLG